MVTAGKHGKLLRDAHNCSNIWSAVKLKEIVEHIHFSELDEVF